MYSSMGVILPNQIRRLTMKLKGLGIYPTFSEREEELLNLLHNGDEWRTNNELEELLDNVFECLNSFGLNSEYYSKLENELNEFNKTDLGECVYYSDYMTALGCVIYDEIAMTTYEWRNENPSNLVDLRNLPTYIDKWYALEQCILHREIVDISSFIHENAFIIKSFGVLSCTYEHYKTLVEEQKKNTDIKAFQDFVCDFKTEVNAISTKYKKTLKEIDKNDIFDETLFISEHPCVVEDRLNLVDESQIIDYFADSNKMQNTMRTHFRDRPSHSWVVANIKDESFVVSLAPAKYSDIYPVKPYYRKMTRTELSQEKKVVLSFDLDVLDYCKLVSLLQKNEIEYTECTDPYFKQSDTLTKQIDAYSYYKDIVEFNGIDITGIPPEFRTKEIVTAHNRYKYNNNKSE